MKEIEFLETQKIKSKIIYLILIVIDLCLLYVCFLQIIKKSTIGTNPISNTGLIILTSIMILSTIFCFFIKLKTIINSNGIYFKYEPIHLKYKFYSWEYINNIYLKKFSPLLDYGGWGIRIKYRIWKRKEIAYFLKGNIGIFCEIKNGKKILIGTQEPENVNEILKKLNKIL